MTPPLPQKPTQHGTNPPATTTAAYGCIHFCPALLALRRCKGQSATFSRTLPTAGTWRVVVLGTAGEGGKLAWSFKLRQPKGVLYSTD